MSRVAFQRAFQELSDEEIAHVRENARRVTFQDGEILIREGEDAGIILVILSGEVRVVRLQQNGGEKELSDPLVAGDTVGEMSFVDSIGASATLIAAGEVQAQSVDRSLIAEMAKEDSSFHGRFYHSLLRTVIRRLRTLDYKISFPG